MSSGSRAFTWFTFTNTLNVLISENPQVLILLDVSCCNFMSLISLAWGGFTWYTADRQHSCELIMLCLTSTVWLNHNTALVWPLKRRLVWVVVPMDASLIQIYISNLGVQQNATFPLTFGYDYCCSSFSRCMLVSGAFVNFSHQSRFYWIRVTVYVSVRVKNGGISNKKTSNLPFNGNSNVILSVQTT